MTSWENIFPDGVWVFVAIVMLGVLHLLALPGHYKKLLPQLVFGVALGLAACVYLNDSLFDLLGWERTGKLAAERVYRPVDIGNRAVILFIGSSYTDLGLNPDVVNAELARQNIPARVMVRAAGGASRLEQWQFTKEAIDVLGQPPLAVFYEISLSYDHRPVYGLKSAYSDRALSQFDWQGAKWVLDALTTQDKYKLKGMEDKAEVLRETVKHVFLSRFNVGLADNMIASDHLIGRPSHSPRSVADNDYDPTKQAEKLRPQSWELDISKLPRQEINPWAAGYFRDVERLLKEQGVEILGFHALPIGSPGRRRYAFNFCLENPDHFCLNGNERSLIEALGPAHWVDMAHLRDTGSHIYSKWVANELIRQGVVK